MSIRKIFEKKAGKGFRGYPIATIAFYGPTNKLATKVAVGIIQNADTEAIMMRWHSEIDIRFNENIFKEILTIIKNHESKSVTMMSKIIGCPHEEGIDYPHGECCPQCPFWANRDRWLD